MQQFKIHKIMKYYIILFIFFISCNKSNNNSKTEFVNTINESDLFKIYKLNPDTNFIRFDNSKDSNYILYKLLPLFRSLKELQIIDIENLDYDKVFYLLKQKRVEELIISTRQINQIPKDIGEITSLKKLEILSDSVIDDWSAISKCKNLERLEISEIKNFPIDYGFLINLKEFNWQSDSCILPNYLDKFQKLIKLDLSNKGLLSFPEQVISLKNLEKLDLGRNKIKTIPFELNGLRRLKYLNLGSNPIMFNLNEIN
jgi:Leucine-rich repeat (LRR) protein